MLAPAPLRHARGIAKKSRLFALGPILFMSSAQSRLSALAAHLSPTSNEFDYVIVGGGTAGCVLANRLTEDPNVSVAVIEGGPSDENEDRVLNLMLVLKYQFQFFLLVLDIL
mgnify:CR=1 FL=1